MSRAWNDEESLLVLELLHSGTVSQRRKAQSRVWQELVELGWARPRLSPEGLVLEERRRTMIEASLDRVRPEWREHLRLFQERELAISPQNWRELARTRRREKVSGAELPVRMSLRTATAQVAAHSKARFTVGDEEAFAGTEVTHDGLVRMRPDASLRLRRGSELLDGRTLATWTGEVMLTDRALRDGTVLEGEPRLVVTVENLGPYQDLVVPNDVLLVHLPGWNTRLARTALAAFQHRPLWHFGDLDASGVRILLHLRRWRPDTQWLVPDFWSGYVERAREADWGGVQLPQDAPAWVADLARRDRWLEQEVVALDPRWRGLWKALSGREPVVP
jgi:hypothetical protein